MGKVGPSVELAMAKILTAEEQKDLVKHLALYLVPSSGAALTFGATLVAAQAAGAAAGISCASPVLASLVGCVAVCSASAASAQVSYSLRKYCSQESPDSEEPFLSKESLIVNALFGVVAFKVLGGSYCNLMPSNVVNPGALARGSIPARGSKYANDVEHGLIQDLYRKHGCHHCGKITGDSIADHMPPNVLAHGRGWATSRSSAQASSFLAKLAASIPLPGIHPKIVQQRFYPQCMDCMKQQSAALRHGKKALVLHFKRGIPEAPYFAGFCIGAMRLDELQSNLKKTNK